MGDGNVIVKFVNLCLIVVMFAFFMAATLSGTWTKTQWKEFLITYMKTDGLYWQCGKDCQMINNPKGWHETCRYLVYLMWVDIGGTLVANCVSLFIKTFRLSKIYGLLYFAAAMLGLMVLIVYPLAVSKVGKEGNRETWLGQGYYCFLVAVFLMFTTAFQCFEMAPDNYPGF